MKIKAILISHASVSVYMKGQKTLRQMILDDWYSLTAQQIKRFHPEIEIECWTPEKIFKEPREFVYKNIRYRQFPTTFSPQYGLDLSLEMLKAMKEEVKKSRKESYKVIFHLHEYHNLHGLMIATLFKKENIIAQHHGGYCPLRHLKENRKYRFFFPFFLIGQIWENMVLKNIGYFYALSEQEINYLKKIAQNSKIKFQTMGIDDYYYKNMKKETARKKLKWPINKKIILFLGRLIPVKGLIYLTDAMEKLKDVELKVIGWGELRKEYENYAKSKKLANIEFIGPVFKENKIPYLSAADAFILPSYKEGASVSVMEALAMNLPVITTDTGGMPLMVKNGREGIVIRQRNSEDIVNAVRKILKWKKKNIRQYAERYRWKKIIDDTVKDYEEI